MELTSIEKQKLDIETAKQKEASESDRPSSLWRRSQRMVLLSLLSLVLLATGFWMSREGGAFIVRDAQIVVIEKENTKYFEGLTSGLKSKIEPLFRGRDLWAVPLNDIQAEIEKSPWILSVNISRRIPDQIRIEIVPKILVGIIPDKKDKFFPVAEDASILPPANVALAPDLPILRAQIFQENKEIRLKATQLLQQLPKEGLLSLENVSDLVLDEKKNFWLMTASDSVRIRLGENNIGARAARVSQVLDYLNRNQLEGRVIDADFSKKVLVKLRNRR